MTAAADSARPSRSGAPSAREPPAPARPQPPSSPGLRPHCARLPSAFGAFPWAHAAERRLATLSTWSAAFAGTRQGEIGWRPRWGLAWVRGGPLIPKAPPGPPHQERLGKAGRAHSPRHRHAERSGTSLCWRFAEQRWGPALRAGPRGTRCGDLQCKLGFRGWRRGGVSPFTVSSWKCPRPPQGDWAGARRCPHTLGRQTGQATFDLW